MEQSFFERFEEEKVRAEKVDAILVLSPANMRSSSGFCGEGLVFISKELKIIYTDSRYTIAAAKECPDCEIMQYEGNIYEYWIKDLMSRVGKQSAQHLKIGFEDGYMTVQSYNTIAALTRKYGLTELQLIPVHKRIDRLRQVKCDSEIKSIKKAEQIGDAAFDKILVYLKDARTKGLSVTEKQIAANLEFFMREMGADGTSFDTIAASGIHSSMPHAVPTDKILEDGDFLTMDFGCKVNGYCSDMTRTIVYGRADDRQKEIYQVVLKAQRESIKHIKPGMSGVQVDDIARTIIADAGYAKCFGHSLGHSVGLEIHETPCFSPKDESIICPGMVITVEPGIYVEGFGGVRIEDVVVITEDGCEDITHSPKDLIEIL